MKSRAVKEGTNLDKAIDRADEKEERGYAEAQEHELYIPGNAVGYAWWRKHHGIHASIFTARI